MEDEKHFMIYCDKYKDFKELFYKIQKVFLNVASLSKNNKCLCIVSNEDNKLRLLQILFSKFETFNNSVWITVR